MPPMHAVVDGSRRPPTRFSYKILDIIDRKDQKELRLKKRDPWQDGRQSCVSTADRVSLCPEQKLSAESGRVRVLINLANQPPSLRFAGIRCNLQKTVHDHTQSGCDTTRARLVLDLVFFGYRSAGSEREGEGGQRAIDRPVSGKTSVCRALGGYRFFFKGEGWFHGRSHTPGRFDGIVTTVWSMSEGLYIALRVQGLRGIIFTSADTDMGNILFHVAFSARPRCYKVYNLPSSSAIIRVA